MKWVSQAFYAMYIYICRLIYMKSMRQTTHDCIPTHFMSVRYPNLPVGPFPFPSNCVKRSYQMDPFPLSFQEAQRADCSFSRRSRRQCCPLWRPGLPAGGGV